MCIINEIMIRLVLALTFLFFTLAINYPYYCKERDRLSSQVCPSPIGDEIVCGHSVLGVLDYPNICEACKVRNVIYVTEC
jgi:hypothetical protein